MPNRSRAATTKSLRTKTTRQRTGGCRAGGTDETGDYLGKVAQPLAIDGGVTSAGIWSGEGNGAQGRSRTTDTAIFSRMLYQLSYLGAPLAWRRAV